MFSDLSGSNSFNFSLFLSLKLIGKRSSALKELTNFKCRCHDFLHNEENLKTYFPDFVDTPTKYILKYIHFEPFKYDILKLKEDISSKLEEKESIILFDYNTNKVFDKSKTYTVELGEEDEV